MPWEFFFLFFFSNNTTIMKWPSQKKIDTCKTDILQKLNLYSKTYIQTKPYSFRILYSCLNLDLILLKFLSRVTQLKPEIYI